jgi:tetratricopeptide (TPR) repeat protein
MLLEAGLYSKADITLQKLIALKGANTFKYKVEMARMYLDNLASYDEVLKLTDEIINKLPDYEKANNKVKAEVQLYDIWAKYKKSATSTTKYTQSQLIDAFNQVLLKYDPTSARAYLYQGNIYITENADKNIVNAREVLTKCIDLDLNNRFTKEANELLKKTI